MKIKAIDYAIYKVSDVKKATEFYEKTLGLQLDSSGDGWAEFNVGNLALVLGSWDFDAKRAGCGNGVALAVDDVGVALAELKMKGVKVEGDAWETPVCWGGTITDTDGNKIYLHKRKDGTSG